MPNAVCPNVVSSAISYSAFDNVLCLSLFGVHSMCQLLLICMLIVPFGKFLLGFLTTILVQFLGVGGGGVKVSLSTALPLSIKVSLSTALPLSKNHIESLRTKNYMGLINCKKIQNMVLAKKLFNKESFTNFTLLNS